MCCLEEVYKCWHHHHHRHIKLVSHISISLKLLRSLNEHGRAGMVHCIMCAVFSVAMPHLHVASPSEYPQMFVIVICLVWLMCTLTI